MRDQNLSVTIDFPGNLLIQILTIFKYKMNDS